MRILTMKKALHTLLLSIFLLTSSLSHGHQGMQPLPRNAFLRREYGFLRPEMLYGACASPNKDVAASCLETERSDATNRFITAHGFKVGLAVGSVLFAFKRLVNPKQHQSPFEVLVWPLIWAMGYADTVLDVSSFIFKEIKIFLCKSMDPLMDPLGFCPMEVVPDLLTSLEVKLLTQWSQFPYNKKLQLGNMIFDLRRGDVQDTTASFAALTNALSLPMEPRELTFNLGTLK